MEPKLGFRHKFAYSFFDFSAYKEFLIQGLGRSIIYIFLVTLIFTTLTNFKEISLINSEITYMQDNLIHNAPKFEFKNGLLSVDSKETIYYKHSGDFFFNVMASYALALNRTTLLNSNSNNAQNSLSDNPSVMNLEDGKSFEADNTEKPSYYMFIIDTNDKTDSSILNNYKDGIFINSKSLTVKENYTTIGNILFSNFNRLHMNNEIFIGELSVLKIILPALLIIIKPIYSCIYNLFLGFLFFGPATLFMGYIMKVKLNYFRACTLSLYSMTLPLLLKSLLEISGIYVSFFAIIFYMITLLYCGLAINEIRKTDKSNLNFMK